MKQYFLQHVNTTLYLEGRILSPKTTCPRFSTGDVFVLSSTLQKSKLKENKNTISKKNKKKKGKSLFTTFLPDQGK
jgi:hypothetical protein